MDDKKIFFKKYPLIFFPKNRILGFYLNPNEGVANEVLDNLEINSEQSNISKNSPRMCRKLFFIPNFKFFCNLIYKNAKIDTEIKEVFIKDFLESYLSGEMDEKIENDEKGV